MFLYLALAFLSLVYFQNKQLKMQSGIPQQQQQIIHKNIPAAAAAAASS